MARVASIRQVEHAVSMAEEIEITHSSGVHDISSSVLDQQQILVRHDPLYEAVKRTIDIVGALVIGAIFLLFLPILAIVIRLDSHGSIFYKQTRVGKDETLFTIWKLRSMRSDAEKEGPKWASANDERVTRVGSKMRSTRLDELPQIWNVLRGEMSLVGPRPERPEFTRRLGDTIPEYAVRHSVKPGLTGWAQIQYQYAATIDQSRTKLEYDLFYIENRSTLFDAKILLRTPFVVYRRTGQ